MKRFPLFLITLLLSLTAAEASTELLKVGRFQSRAILRLPESPAPTRRAAVILIPGSGSQGPESRIPGTMTATGKEVFLLDQFAIPLTKSGVISLQLGKPGLLSQREKPSDKAEFYDANLYQNLHWNDLIANVRDAISFLKAHPNVDSSRIYLLGHSEGTQVALDTALMEPSVRGLILLGYSGRSISETLDFQLFEREIEWFAKRDLDNDRDGLISRSEAAAWPSFRWPWKPAQQSVSIQEIRSVLRASPERQAVLSRYQAQPLYQGGIWNRPPIARQAVKLHQPIWVITGEWDVQTEAREALDLAQAARQSGKMNLHVRILPKLGHGFSEPTKPRQHPLLDANLGPPREDFLQILENLGREF